MFGYFGAIASYIVIAIPIFAGVYDGLDEPALAEGTTEYVKYPLQALIARYIFVYCWNNIYILYLSLIHI